MHLVVFGSSEQNVVTVLLSKVILFYVRCTCIRIFAETKGFRKSQEKWSKRPSWFEENFENNARFKERAKSYQSQEEHFKKNPNDFNGFFKRSRR